MTARKFAPRPESVLVGFLNYRIEYLDETEWLAANEDGDAGGTSRHTQASIRVRMQNEHAEQNIRETLLHEIVHCVWGTTGVNQLVDSWTPEADKIEEVVISMTTPGLLFVLQQNPVVAAYLMDTRDH